MALSFAASVSFLLVNVVDPYSGAVASPHFNVADRFGGQPEQTLDAPADIQAQDVTREAFGVKEAPKPPPVASAGTSSSGGAFAPPAGTPDPGSAQAYAHSLLLSRGLGEDEFSCLVALWNRESHWNVYAHNSSSGAYGIPQALPGSKMASAGADWQTSAETQINWGLGYISGRYGTPCGAWAHSESNGWY